MIAHESKIAGIFEEGVELRVPFFQRRYVWDEDNWQRFAEDMESTPFLDKDYFLGAVILKDEELREEEREEDRSRGVTSRRTIIDGQQRLTTLCIYMKILHMMTGQGDRFNYRYMLDGNVFPIIKHSLEDAAAFNAVMRLDVFHERLEGRRGAPLNNIYEAYNYFSEHLRKMRDDGMDMSDLLSSINSRVSFVFIRLQQTEDEQQIFDTINSLGAPLTTGDLIKNFLFNDRNMEEQYRETWRPMFDTDEAKEFWHADSAKQKQAKKKYKLVDRFFHAFVRIKMWDFDDLTDFQRKQYVKEDNVVETCKAFVTRHGMSRDDLIAEIMEYAKLYKKYFGKNRLDESIGSTPGIKRIACIINALDNTSIAPYVLYLLRNVQDTAERNRIFGKLEAYVMRRVLAKSDNNSYSDLFTENLLHNYTNTVDGFVDYINSKGEDANLAIPSEEAIRDALWKGSINERRARLIFYMQETKSGRIDGAYNDYTAIQLMPKPSTRNAINWPRLDHPNDEAARKALIETLGNFFIVQSARNMTKWANSSLAEKKAKMIELGANMDAINEWTHRKIKERDENLAGALCRTWPWQQ